MEMEGWGALPTVVLVNVYNFLSVKDRLNASSVSKHWRLPAFQVLWRDHLSLSVCKSGDIPKAIFLTQEFMLKVSHVEIVFNAAVANCLDMVQGALTTLISNDRLITLKLTSSESYIIALDNKNPTQLTHQFATKVLKPLEKILKARNNLKTFSFPLIQNMSSVGNKLFSILLDTRYHKKYSIQNLFLPSIRDLSHVVAPPPSIQLSRINSFVNLQMLSVEYDSLTDDILGRMGVDSNVGGLKRLSLVALRDNHNVSNAGWALFAANNVDCKVRLTVSEGAGLMSGASNLIFPTIPLSHFRTYNCKGMRMNFLNSVVRWNTDTLEHLELVDDKYDWIEISEQAAAQEQQFLDPIVHAAWTCVKLHTIKIGFLYCGDLLMGIAKLKGPQLVRLEIPKSQVKYHSFKQLNKEISKALERPWKPLGGGGGGARRKTKFSSRSSKSRVGSLVKTLGALQTDETED